MSDGKKQIDSLTENGFLKTVSPSVAIPSGDKAKLNLEGNRLMNQGSIEQAKKIFLTTRYSDGLCRVGDYYRDKSDPATALKFYTLSGRKDKYEPLVENAVQIIRTMLKEDETKISNK